MYIIKKYANRRLYDTKRRKYITLQDVKQLVFDHVEFQVIDAHSEKDITQTTLLQIIIEQEGSTPLFTTPLLQELIRSYQEKTHEAFSQYLEQAMHFFAQQKDFFQNQWKSYQDFFANPSFTDYVKKMQEMWQPKEKDEKDDKNK